MHLHKTTIHASVRHQRMRLASVRLSVCPSQTFCVFVCIGASMGIETIGQVSHPCALDTRETASIEQHWFPTWPGTFLSLDTDIHSRASSNNSLSTSSCSISAFSPVTHSFIRVHSILPFHFRLCLATCRSSESSSSSSDSNWPSRSTRQAHHCQSGLAGCMADLGQGHSCFPHLHCKALSKHKHQIKTCQERHLRKRCNLQVSRYMPAGQPTERLLESLVVPWQCRVPVSANWF